MEHTSSPSSPEIFRRRKLLVGGAIVAAALIGLLGWGMARPGAASQYVTPSEVARAATPAATELRLTGVVVAGSIERVGLTTSFRVTDGDLEVPVSTDSPLPDAFKDSSEVVAIGTYDGDSFAAVRVLAKCPSKFKAKE